MSQERYKIASITDSITAIGLKLSGIGEVTPIEGNESASNILSVYATDPSVAVIIITEDIAEENRALLNKITLSPWPVVVEIPGPRGKSESSTSTIRELVKRALGIEIDI